MSFEIKTPIENQARGLRPSSSKTTPIDSVKEAGLEDQVFKLSYEDLACYTENFSETNYLNHFQFGKLYRGKIVGAQSTQYVLVKIWEVSKIYEYWDGDNEGRLMDEVLLLRHESLISHPGMVKLYGFCFEDDHLGIVYDFEPFDSVFNLAPKDDFTWLQRIKVALRLASLLKFLHTAKCSFYKPFIVRNLDCAHILVDKDYNPKLCDFGMITGGVCPDRRKDVLRHVLGSYGYIDLGSVYRGESSGKQDVYAFGVILLNLISKRVYESETRGNYGEDVCLHAWKEYCAYEISCIQMNDKKIKFSVVHDSLKADPDFEPADEYKISELFIDCTELDPSDRPTMRQVLRSMFKLKVVKKHAHLFGLNQV